jgi:4-hydroxy-2-oxoglutarate aldolase
MTDLSGVFIPCVTPFDPVTGEVDLVGFRANVRDWLEHPIRGVVVGGSTGEAVLLDEWERAALLEGARDLMPEDRLLVAGTGAESTRATIRLCRMAAEKGADAVLVQPPAFYKGAMTDETLIAHYHRVAAESPAPVILYQVPLRLSTLDFSTHLVETLSEHENVIGIKDSRGKLELVGELVTRSAGDFQVLVGSGALLYGALELGAVGGILGVANYATADSAGIYEAFARGDSAEAGRIQERVAPAHNDIVAALGVPGVKVAVDMIGMKGGDPRAPLRPLGTGGRDAVEKALREAGLEVVGTAA